MDNLPQQLYNGLIVGSIYALVALGYTMVYGILELINFAHGEIVMMGAMIALAVISVLLGSGLDIPGIVIVLIGLSAAMVACMVLGFTIERIAYRPLRRSPRLAALITAIGVSFILQNLAMLFWGRGHISFPDILPNAPFVISPGLSEIRGSYLQLTIVMLSFTLMAGLWFLVKRTQLGRAMRATAQSPELAGLMGINPNHVISATFIIGAALAAVAGVMNAAYYALAHAHMGSMLGLKAFTAAVLGGIGNIVGAMVGGLLFGIVESIGGGYLGQLSGGFLGSHYQNVFAFLVLIVVLVFRPTGLFGERVGDRA